MRCIVKTRLLTQQRNKYFTRWSDKKTWNTRQSTTTTEFCRRLTVSSRQPCCIDQPDGLLSSNDFPWDETQQLDLNIAHHHISLQYYTAHSFIHTLMTGLVKILQAFLTTHSQPVLLLLLLLLQLFYAPLSGTTRVSRYQKNQSYWILLKLRWWGGSGINWTICKLFALCSIW